MRKHEKGRQECLPHLQTRFQNRRFLTGHACLDNLTMKNSAAIEAILIKPHLDRFCEEFGLSSGELEPDFTGWSKHIIKSPDLVFLFPRHPRYQSQLNTELKLYKLLNVLDGLPVPRFVRSVDSCEWSTYPFGVVTRLHGMLLGTIERSLRSVGYEQVFRSVGRLAGIWHDLKLGPETGFLKPLTQDLAGDHADSYRWMYGVLQSKSLEEVSRLIEPLFRGHASSNLKDEFKALTSANSIAMWQQSLSELAGMDNVLLHGDIHEDQVLVRSDRDLVVTGILDWGNAGIGNPALEFNFGEWGGELWRYRDEFSVFREALWSEYLDARGLHGPPWESVHLLYSLQELIWTMTARKSIGHGGGSYESEVERLLRTLKETTEVL